MNVKNKLQAYRSQLKPPSPLMEGLLPEDKLMLLTRDRYHRMRNTWERYVTILCPYYAERTYSF